MGVGGQRHAPAALPPGKRPGTHCIGGWVGPRAGLDGCGKPHLQRDSIPGLSRPLRVAKPTELSWPLSNTSVVIKLRIIAWARHTERLRVMKFACDILVGKHQQKKHVSLCCSVV